MDDDWISGIGEKLVEAGAYSADVMIALRTGPRFNKKTIFSDIRIPVI